MVYVVLLNWNGWKDTLACIASLRSDLSPGLRLVVCDNGSADDSTSRLTAQLQRWFGSSFRSIDRAAVDELTATPHDAEVWLVKNHANLGFAAGNNVGIRFALLDPACQYVWLLNNDTEVAPDALAQALAHMQAQPQLGLCGSTLVYHHDRQTIQAWAGAVYSRWTGRTRHLGAFTQLAGVPLDGAAVEQQLSCVVGAAMLVSRPFLEQVGLMREDYFLYYEEIDWATRAKGRFKLGYAPRSVVFHKEGASIGTTASGGSPLSMFYLFRNRIRFTWRFHRPYLPVVLAVALLDVAKMVWRRRWPQAAAALRGVLQLAQPSRPQPHTSV